MKMNIINEWKLKDSAKLNTKVSFEKLSSTSCLEHPLGTSNLKQTTTQQLLKNNSLINDPLNILMDGNDPLTFQKSINALSPLLQSSSNSELKLMKEDESNIGNENSCTERKFIPWDEYKANFLAKFHTKQKLTLTSSFLSTSNTETVVTKTQAPLLDRNQGSDRNGAERVKSRLEQLDILDDLNSGGLNEMGGLTQEQFTQHLMTLKQEMEDSWHADQKVKALKIAIQCAKSLSLSLPEIFYPYKFMIVSDILDSLGSLVYKRLVQLLKFTSSPLRNSSFEAVETARNWFCKVASIRELLPRLYLEAALIHCYTLLEPEENVGVLERLISMCRGIGDPLVSSYARMFIVKAGLNVRDAGSIYLKEAIEDQIECFKWGWNGKGIECLESSDNENTTCRSSAEKVFMPPLNWLMQCFCKSANTDELAKLSKLGHDVKGLNMYMFARCLMKCYPVDFLVNKSSLLCTYLHYSVKSGEHPHEAMIELADVFNRNAPPEEFRVKIMNVMWRLVSEITVRDIYLQAATPWIQYSALYFTVQDLHKILSDVLKSLTNISSSNSTSYYSSLLQMLTVTITHTSNTEELFELSSFQGLLGAFQRECGVGVGRSCGITEMKSLLETLLQNCNHRLTNPNVVQLLLSLFCSLHDGINALTTQDEKRQIAQLVNNFIRLVDYDDDFDLQLEFYVDSRSAFSNLDSVLENLIQHVCRLQITAMKSAGRTRTPTIASFVRASTAYCFITISSLPSPIDRLKLYLLCGSIAMINNCMGQGDACIKSAVKEVLELSFLLSEYESKSTPSTSSMANDIVNSVCYISAFLVAQPDPPESSQPLYLFRGLSNGIKSLEQMDHIHYCQISLAVIKGVCATSQLTLPYHFNGVDGNDVLYGGDLSIKLEAEIICTDLLEEIFICFKKFRFGMNAVEASFICDLLETIWAYADVNDKGMKKIVKGMIALIDRFQVDTKIKYRNRLKHIITTVAL